MCQSHRRGSLTIKSAGREGCQQSIASPCDITKGECQNPSEVKQAKDSGDIKPPFAWCEI